MNTQGSREDGMTTATLEAILDDLSQVVSRIDEVHLHVLHGELELPFSTVKEYQEEVRGQAQDMVRCVVS
jgi:hypothetical protein